MLERLGLRFRRNRSSYEPTATLDDIAACFRLLLGRQPHREEWRGHAMRVGEALPGVVASYVNSLEFFRRGLLAQDHMQDVELATLPDFVIYTAGDDAAVGRYVRENQYEHDVSAVFREVLRPGMGVLDIGANIGYFTMLSAALVGSTGHVLAIEPNPRNVRLLEASRRVNRFGQVCVAQIAAGEQTGLLVLHRSHSNGTTSDLPDDPNAVMGAEIVGCMTADSAIDPNRQIDLIKVDVEGAEYRALRGCQKTIARCRPMIISEFSPDMMPGISGIDGPGYLHWLIGQGYALSVIAPNGARIRAADPGAVMAAYAASGVDHIDIFGMPLEQVTGSSP